MSAKERDRLKVLHDVSKRHITQKQAAAELGLSVRWVRKLLVRQRTRGDGALRHGLRGRASNRKTPEAVKRTSRGTLPQEKAGQAMARLRPHASDGRASRAARDPGEPGDAAPVADRGQVVAAPAGTGG